MTYKSNSDIMREVETGNQSTPSSASLRRWWSRPIVTIPASNDRKPTCKEHSAVCVPVCGGFFTIIAVFLLLIFVDKASSHAKISIKSIDVSPSTATWHIDFLIKNPSSRYSICYDGDDASVRLGNLNAAILNTSHLRSSKDHTAFSLTFITEGNQSTVVSEELGVKLKAKHKRYIESDEAGLIDIRCLNLTRSHDKIKCYSSFKPIHLIAILRHGYIV